MEHLDSGTLENWYANRAMPFPTALHRLAVVAPDDAPGLSALRQRLAQRAPHGMRCDHFAASFSGAASAGLADAFEQIQSRHAAEPYDIVLLLEGRPDALGIAESNGLIPQQVSRTPAPVWTAIGEDDANTTLGDVANRVFSSPAALIAALPFPAQQSAAAASPAAAVPQLPLETPAGALLSGQMPAAALAPAAMMAARTTAHPLVLCAAGAVIIASLTAIAAMLGWLPTAPLAAAHVPGRTAAHVLPAPSAPQAAVLRAAETPAASIPEALPEPAPLPATPQGNGAAQGAVLAAVGAAGIMASTPRGRALNPPATRAKRPQRRNPANTSGYAQAPRQVGSTEVPVLEFVGTKTREQVVAEMMEARRAANRQAAGGSYFPGLGGPSSRR